MNREITFRGKSTLEKENKWFYGNLIVTELGQYALRFEKNRDVQIVPVDPETVGQLYHENKHGKIFEGDIVEDIEKGVRMQVYWDTSLKGFCFSIDVRAVENYDSKSGPYNHKLDNLVVVGNVFDKQFHSE